MGKFKKTFRKKYPQKRRTQKRRTQKRKGGMWRMRKKDQLPQAQIPEDNDAHIAWAYNPNRDTDVVPAESYYAPISKVDTADYNQQLTDIYKEIKQDGLGYLMMGEDGKKQMIVKLLKKFPDFDVTIHGADGTTLLDKAISNNYVKTSKLIINFPTMTKDSLEHSLEHLDKLKKTYGVLNQYQQTIKTIIQNKLSEI